MAETFFERVHKQDTHMPDVLSCLANLSNDEVFTPPDLVNKVLDLLPQELFKDPNAKFLDPATKTGVFLREIAKRLLVGLEPIYPDLQERIDHIFHEQLYGMAITELTSLLARRSLYCSKYPNGKYSISSFDDPEGNITFKKTQHVWKDGKCIYCGARQEIWEREEELETHAYSFIHCAEENNKMLFERLKNMKFDVIIGNPPYQLSDGGFGASASPIYQLFVEQAKRLNPRYLTMIIPSRWMTGGKGLDEFRFAMLHDSRIRVLVDYFDATECFPGIDLSGGVCYFLWDRDHQGDCRVISNINGKTHVLTRPLLEKNQETFVRFNNAMDIVHKIQRHKEDSLEQQLSSQNPYGINTNFREFAESGKGNIKLYAYPNNGFIRKSQIPKNHEWISKYKVCISNAYGERGNFPYFVLGKPFISEPNSCSTATYMVMGVFDKEKPALNFISYVKTKFFRFLVLLKKHTQHAARGVYEFVPLQDFTQEWTDAKLYKKYGLTKEEIAFIDSMIKPMEDK